MLPLAIFVLAVFAFMPASLVGQRTKLAVDLLEQTAPYRDAIGRKPEIVNVSQGDTLDFQPLAVLFYRSLRSGNWQNWDPSSLAGTPLGTLPLEGILSPTSFGFLVLPAWYAVTIKLALLLLVSLVFMYLLLLRLGTGRAAATLAAIAYTFCGANMVLAQRLNEVFVLPVMFWAAHRLCERPTFRRASVLAVAIAVSWFEGFPSGFAYTLAMTAAWAAWLIWRSAARERERAGRSDTRGVAERLVAFVGATALGLAISAVQLLPFAEEVLTRGTLDTRTYTSRDHLGHNFFFGMFDLSVIGRLTNPSKWWTGSNPVESVAFVGSLVTLGVLCAFVRSARGNLRLSPTGRDAWPFMCVLLAAMVVLTFEGTFLLGLAYDIPGFGNNPLTRSRFAIAFAAAVIAALGIDDWWSKRAASRREREQPSRVLAIAATAVIVVLAVRYARAFYSAAGLAGVRHNIAKSVMLSLALAVLGLVLAFIMRRTSRKLVRVGGIVLLATLLFVQLAVPFRNFIPESPVSDFYTTQEGHRVVKRLTGGHYRFAADENDFNTRSNEIIGWNDLRGPGLWSQGMKNLIGAANYLAFYRDAFRVILTRDEWNLGSPVYDQLAVRYFGLGTNKMPYGLVDPEVPSTMPRPTRDGRHRISTTVAVAPTVSGIGLRIGTRGARCDRARLTVGLRFANGRVVEASKPASDAALGGWSFFALQSSGLAQPEVADLTVSTTGDCVVSVGRDRTTGAPVVRWIQEDPRVPLRVVSTEQAWIYERPNAWEIVSAHSTWRSFHNQRALLRVLAKQPPGPSETALFVGDAPRRVTSGAPAKIRSVAWTNNGVRIRTDGRATSLIVISQDLPDGWSAAVDGRSASPVRVDGTLAGVFVGPGAHTIRLTYRPASFVVGALITVTALIMTVVVAVIDPTRRMRRRRESRAR